MEVNTEAEGRLAEAREALAGGLMDAWGVEDGRNWGEPLHPRTMGVIMAFEEAVRASERASLQMSTLDPDIGTWANVIMAVEGMEEEVEARAGRDDESTRTLTLFSRVLRSALNTCRGCGVAQPYNRPLHARDCQFQPVLDGEEA